MIAALRALAGRARRWESGGVGKTWLAAIALLLVVGAGLPPFLASLRYSSLLSQVTARLRAFDRDERTPEAIALLEQGTLDAGGRTLGGERVKAVIEQVIGGDGKIELVQEFAGFIAAPEAPGWLPVALLEQPWLVAGIALSTLAFLLGAVLLSCALEVAAALLAALALASPFWLTGMIGPFVSVFGIGLMACLFVVAMRGAAALLSGRRGVLAVAHTVLKEAGRERISAAFIGIVLVALPLIPLWIDAASPLRYQIQTYMSRSLGVVFACGACMVVLLGCSTTSFEIRDRQVWQVLTKPLSRLSYLAGKWLGVATAAAVLLLVSGVAVFGYVQFLRTRPATDLRDALAVRQEVLAARHAERPIFEEPTRERLTEMVEAEIAADPALRQDIADGVQNEPAVRAKLAAAKLKEFLSRQRAIDPGASRTYTFPGVGRDLEPESPLSLRFVFHTGASDSHQTFPVIFRFPADGSWTDRMYIPAQGHELSVAPRLLDADGALRVEVMNVGFDGQQFVPGPSTIYFDPDGLEVLFPVGSFEANFLRSMAVEWTKLAFLAMLGVCAGAIFGFPVASLLTFTIFVVALLTPFLGMSLEYYYASADTPAIGRLLHAIVKGIAIASRSALAAFGDARPVDRLVEGRVVPWSEVVRVGATVGVLWGGAVLLVGWAAFRRKEIAIYSGQG